MRAESWPHRISVPMRRDSRRPALSFSTMWGHVRRQPSAGHQGSSHPTRHQIGRHLGLPSLQNWENNFSCLSHPAYGIVMAARAGQDTGSLQRTLSFQTSVTILWLAISDTQNVPRLTPPFHLPHMYRLLLIAPLSSPSSFILFQACRLFLIGPWLI